MNEADNRGPLVLIGGGEHARVVADAAVTAGWVLLGYADERPSAGWNIQWLGTDRQLLAARPPARYVVAIGGVGQSGAALRARVVAAYDEAGITWARVIHKRAWVSDGAQVRNGAVIMAGALVNVGAVLGDHAIVNTGAIVEHDVRIGKFCHVGPGAVIGGGAVIDDNAALGLGCRVRDHVHVGAGAVVGMGAAVVTSIEAGATVVGVPARALRRGD